MTHKSNHTIRSFLSYGIALWFSCILSPAHATPSDSDLSVWANEAIVSAYTFTADNFLARQKEIAKYFTAKSWITYTKALETAKLKESVQKNKYEVSAVALLPPTIKLINNGKEWQANMPLMVLYKNKSYQQKQTLAVVITFAAQSNEGVRGLALTSFNTTITTPACRCEKPTITKTFV
ncbi:MAG: DotI/IcmL family type IV secretion protein [Gammaproteobacteria bacterium]|nr:DotI/IcmL family type IV secretion protein [Gammaproteobacteria bacterium]